MLPGSQPNEPRNSSKVNLLISLAFHAAILLLLAYFAAREGFFGGELKKIAVQMVKEKPPENPKEPEKPKPLEQPKVEPPKPETPKIVDVPKVEAPKETPRVLPPADTAPAIAPPPAEVPSFEFGGGKTVQSSSDPVQIYQGFVERALRARWNRPAGIADDYYVAEVEISVDRTGQVSDPEWKKGSGDSRWDDSVRQAIAATQRLSTPPPADFPSRVLVRFDVQETQPFAP